MNKINISLLKKLRKKTQLSIDKCKKALLLNDNNLEKSIKYLKNLNYYINDNNLKYGLISNKIKSKKAAMIKINCKTDFTTLNKEIINFSDLILNFILKNNILYLEEIKKKFHKKINFLKNKFNENIKIKDFCLLKGKYINNYLHNYKIGTIILVEKINKNNIKLDNKKIKKISMHITASNPNFISINDIPDIIKYDLINNIKKKKIINNYNEIENKKKIQKKIKLKLKEITLYHQQFIFNTKLTVNNYLKKNNILVKKFYRFQVK